MCAFVCVCDFTPFMCDVCVCVCVCMCVRARASAFAHICIVTPCWHNGGLRKQYKHAKASMDDKQEKTHAHKTGQGAYKQRHDTQKQRVWDLITRRMTRVLS